MTTTTRFTPEQKAAWNAQVAELRDIIKPLADYRTKVNRAFRLPHGSAEFAAAVEAIASHPARVRQQGEARCKSPFYGIRKGDRFELRDDLTLLHITLASLRGKTHGKPVQPV